MEIRDSEQMNLILSKILKEGIKMEQSKMSKLYPIVLKRVVKKELNAYYPAKLLSPILAETKREYISIAVFCGSRTHRRRSHL